MFARKKEKIKERGDCWGQEKCHLYHTAS